MTFAIDETDDNIEVENLLDEERIGRSHIAVIDDDETDVLFLKRVLDWAGYANVTGWTDPIRALSACKEDPPDLVLLDLHMPVIDGFEVLSQLRSHGLSSHRLPVLVLTGDPRPDVKRKALAMGASDFVMKPADATEIMIRVRNFLETRELFRQLEAFRAA